MVSSKRFSQRINAHLDAAKAYSKLSHARRLKVGAVVVKDDRVISIGYNGTPTGRNNSCEWLVWPGSQTKFSLEKISEERLKSAISEGATLVSKDEVVHAEANAILFAAKHGISTDNCSLIITHSPCFECAKMIAQSGIREVFYEEEYRDLSSVKFLQECGLSVRKI